MALKVALVAALIVALVAVGSTSTNDEEEGKQRCPQVFKREYHACQTYLKQSSSGEYLDECCEQLREMDNEQCGCEAIGYALRQAQQQGGRTRYLTALSEEMYQKARALPCMCGLHDHLCHFNFVFV